MYLFVIVVTYDPGEIFLQLFKLCFIGGHMTPNSRGTQVGVLLFMLFLLKPLFELLLSLLGGLCITKSTICGLKVLGL